MKSEEFIELMQQTGYRMYVLGSMANDVIIALYMEGRLFTVINSEVINKVMIPAGFKRSNKNAFQNLEGDLLWSSP